MDTPPYSDVSAQLSPGAHALHVNGDAHPAGTNTVAHANGGTTTGTATGTGTGLGTGTGTMDVRALYATSWSALDTPPPPTLREILSAYRQKGDGDRDMLLAMLNAKSAEDQRIASQLSLRRTMLEINNQTTEPHTHSHPHLQYPHASHSHAHGQHMCTYLPEEPYILPAPHQQHHNAPSSPSALPHNYTHNYAPAHSHAPYTQAHLRALESPPLPSAVQKGALPAMRTRPARSRSRGVTRLGDTRSQTHAQSQSQSLSQSHSQAQTQTQAQSQIQSQSQSQRRKRARRSRSRSLVSSSSRRPYAYARSPPSYSHSHSTSHSHSHSLSHSELDPERSPYASASDSGSPHAHARGQGQGQGQANGYPRTMTIGSLLSSGSKLSDARSSVPSANANGAAAAARVKEERVEQEQELEMEQEMELEREDEREREEGWSREHERRGSRDER